MQHCDKMRGYEDNEVMADILIVEDDKHISELMKRNLKLVGHSCTQCYSSMDALRIFGDGVHTFDLVLLDVMLPEISGFDLIDRLGQTPVIFVSAKGELESKLKGLSLGAEDYIVKPFEMLELVARVGVVLRRSKKDEQIFRLGQTEVDLNKRLVFVDGEEALLTPQEFHLLEVLIRNKNIALSRDKLLEMAWGYDYEGETKTVDVHILKLRKKLHWENYIKTITKLGYRLEVLD